MLVTIVVRTKDEASRLRLVLASLQRQTAPLVEPGERPSGCQVAAELIVVNDGSTDETRTVLGEAELPLRAIHHERCLGRSAASNAGARAAAGELLLFLDGDVLAAPNLVAQHAATVASPTLMGRGENYHLRCTRFFRDPETGTPNPGCEEQVRRMGRELEANRVTRRQVLESFADIVRRAQPAIYPGAGPRKLYELEQDALQNHPGLSVLWMAAAGQNLSVPRDAFLAVGGFDERIDMNEHRELALRLQQHGLRLVAVPAKTYHLTHRAGWRDPLADRSWERIFLEKHPCPAVKLMPIFWLSIGGDTSIPEPARIHSLPELEAILCGATSSDYDALRRAHPLLRMED